MKRYVTGLLALIAVAVILAGTMWLGRSSGRQRAIPASELPVPITIETSHPQRRDFSLRLHWFGKAESKRIVKVTALSDGQITAIKPADGAHVKRGAILFNLGGLQMAHRLKALEQRVAVIEQRLALAKVMVQNKQEAVAEKIAKKEDLLAAAEHLTQLSGEQSDTKQKLAVFRDALLLRSPMDGIFTNRRVSISQEVEKGTYLADVISTELRIIAHLFPPPEVPLVGKTVTVQVAAGMDITGIIKKVLPERTVEGATVAWIEGSEINNTPRPGESTSGWIILEIKKKALAVPERAIVRDEREKTFIFVKTPQGYQKKEVKIGLTDGKWFEIVSGLSDEDEVVIRGAYELFYRNFAKTYKVAD